MNISIFGLGYVGCVSLGCLAQNGHYVIGVDVSETKVSQINKGIATIVEKDIDKIIKEQRAYNRIRATTDYSDAVLNSEISIIAVGTPSSAKGHLNLDYIFHVAGNIAEVLSKKNSFHVVAIRSTVFPGTCEKFARIIEEKTNKKNNVDFAVIDNPEFLREGSAVRDYYNPPLTLIGSDCDKAAEKMKSLYAQLPAEIIITDVKVAEIMKYVNNTFHALKISFANEIGNICSALNIDSHKVMEIFCKDKQLNISPYYFKPGFAYGGSCLPKDLKGLQTLAHDLYVKAPVIESIDKTNEIQIHRAVGILSKYFGKKIAVLGISFKAGTDDLRNSPFVEVIEILLGRGYDLCIYDENIEVARLTGKNKEYIEHRIPHLAGLLSNDLETLVAESDVIVVSNKEEQFEVLLKKISGKIILDMVKLPEEVKNANTYIGINW
jgi:GDP-mannose 6-dehydrogenase